MEIRLILLLFSLIACGLAEPIVYSARLVHRFSDEAKAHAGVRVSKNGAGTGGGPWPQRRSLEYYRRLLNYMWIALGTPKVSFLVALDTGSDLSWVPCDCVQCAPLSSSYYGSLDQDLNEYNPSSSSTSKTLSCSHHLCNMGPECLNPKQQCSYTVNYYSDDTSTSGFLVQDVLHLLPGHSDGLNKSVRAPVVIGCGSKQTGGYLSGVAPDGLLGLGLGEISVPSFLAKAGYIKNSFSLCFNEDDSGRLLFGDQGVAGQETTPFLPFNGKNSTYIVGVDACCIGSTCLNETNVEMLVDSGTSFTFLPDQIYQRVVEELDKQVNASKSTFKGYPWQYCYKSSSLEVSKVVPSFTLKFASAKGFVIKNPVFDIYGTQGAVGFCLAIQPTTEIVGTIGRHDLNNGVPLNASSSSNSPNSLPSTEQQSGPNGHAVSPAVAERTPSTSSITCPSFLVNFFLLLFINILPFEVFV
ncbi:eukaryotic aspartyl protease family protein [Striga asiatica]|uniref:Eukaryotic aspartyl protease family protein n=1 Tax=Striga asiatica TaxID=4170 RepID=A0A5A7PQX6_STRAF|nr:eukaryotic aspartyl protease family protein [Striga asiatica]